VCRELSVVKMLITTYMQLDAAIDAEMRTGCHIIVKSLASRSCRNAEQHHCDARMKRIALYRRGIRLKYALRACIPYGLWPRDARGDLVKQVERVRDIEGTRHWLKGQEVFEEAGQDVTRFDSVRDRHLRRLPVRWYGRDLRPIT
jgi:hypothetical protein